VESIGATKKDGQRAKNMFALGLLSWMYGRPILTSENFIREKFVRKPDVAEANVLALKAGWNYGETTEAFGTTYQVNKAALPSGEYRQISGNTALAYGLVAAGQLADKQVMLGSYRSPRRRTSCTSCPSTRISTSSPSKPKTRSADLRRHRRLLRWCAGVTSTSGPGVSLKSEALGLGVMTELPLIVIDVQRGGPSTGLPTKTEQADLLQALFGRNGESPVAVVAPQSPSDCFEIALEAVRIAVSYHTPVIVLSDGAIANGSEPWRVRMSRR